MDIKGSRTEKHTCRTYLTGDDADLAVLWFWHKLDVVVHSVFTLAVSSAPNFASFYYREAGYGVLAAFQSACSHLVNPGSRTTSFVSGSGPLTVLGVNQGQAHVRNRDSAFLRSNTAKTRLGILPHFFRLFFTALVCFQTHLLFSAQMYGFL
ncbi:hypothetical protein DFH05DRAFT_266509 [Lentinula detonsa]|uniref:Uncharacterized protein n=1 Tax=Lentinula detonsa TaxID=2804962 RepID=A0A9W8NWA3_9AGAR|nr:hypothetical protein DFH05DRAFT_266509 [Lentinula detonsa]